MSRYANVCIPKRLAELIDENIHFFGYSSRADFVKQACRRELEKLKEADK